MPLPPITPQPTTVVELPTGPVTIRSITRGERLRLAAFPDDPDEATTRSIEAFLLACALDVTEAEAAVWLYQNDEPPADMLLRGIIEHSGLAAPTPAGEVPPADPSPGSTEEPDSDGPSSAP